MLKLAEELLLDHEQLDHKIFLITSAGCNEGVSAVGMQLSQLLGNLHEGSIFVYDGSSTKDHKPEDVVRADFFEQLRKRYSIVLVAVEDLSVDGEALPFLSFADAAILVVKARITTRAQVKQTATQIARAGVSVLSGVLYGTFNPLPDWLSTRLR